MHRRAITLIPGFLRFNWKVLWRRNHVARFPHISDLLGANVFDE